MIRKIHYNVTFNRNGYTDRKGTREVVIELYSDKERTVINTHIRARDDELRYGRFQDCCPFMDEYNQIVSKMVRELTRIEAEMVVKDRQCTPRKLKEAYLNHFTETATLRDFMHSIIDNDSSRCKTTKNAYLYLVNDLEKEFGELHISDISYDLIIRYREYQRAKGLSENTIKGRLKALNCLCHEALKRDVITDDPFKRITIGNIGGRKGGLTASEVRRLESLELSGKDARVRDMFVLSCYCGLRYSDIVTLHEAEIRNGILYKTMQKTRHEVVLPIGKLFNGKPLEIIGRYPDIRDMYKGLNNTTVNRILKELAVKAHIRKRLYFHISRKTFSQMLSSLGMSTSDISFLLGHKEVKTTCAYYLFNDADRVNKSVRKLFK